MRKQVCAGYNRIDWFLNPKREPVDAAGHWFTNLPIKDRPKARLLKFVPLEEIPERFKKIDDSNILCVDNCFIPCDYDKPFAISTRPLLNGILDLGYNIIRDTEYYPYINGKKKFARILIQKA